MNKKYWLRGAIVYVVSGAIYAFWFTGDEGSSYLVGSMTLADRFFNYAELVGYILLLPFEEVVSMIFGFGYGLSDRAVGSILFLVGIPYWIAVGSFFGFLYGKIRSRKQVGMTTN